MAWCRCVGGTVLCGKRAARVSSIVPATLRAQSLKPRSDVLGFITREIFQLSFFEDADALLGIAKNLLAIFQQRKTALIGGKRFLERQLAVLHAFHNGLKLG